MGLSVACQTCRRDSWRTKRRIRSTTPTTNIARSSGPLRLTIQNAAGVILTSGLAGVAVDNAPYPASGCSDTATPGNCIIDAQIQAEMQRVMTLLGWTSEPNKVFLLYTSSGEGSCFDTGA